MVGTIVVVAVKNDEERVAVREIVAIARLGGILFFHEGVGVIKVIPVSCGQRIVVADGGGNRQGSQSFGGKKSGILIFLLLKLGGATVLDVFIDLVTGRKDKVDVGMGGKSGIQCFIPIEGIIAGRELGGLCGGVGRSSLPHRSTDLRSPTKSIEKLSPFPVLKLSAGLVTLLTFA